MNKNDALIDLYVDGFDFIPYEEYRHILVEPIAEYTDPKDRDDNYHAGRVLYFRDCFLLGKRVDPIDLYVLGYKVFATDGHHRLAGAILAGRRTIGCKVVARFKGLQ